MKRTYLISIFLILIAFVSCKRNEITYEIKLDQQSISIKPGETTLVNIQSGNGNYSFSFSKTGIATANITSNSINITAESYGQTTLKIEDSKGKTSTVTVNVTNSDDDIIPQFSWDNDAILLEEPNNWGLTFSSKVVAITNIHQKSQYYISWNGGLHEGQKSNGVFKIVKNGQLIQTILLTTVSVSEINSKYYSIRFNKDDKNGEIIFTK